MIKEDLSATSNTWSSAVEITTMDDVRRVVDCRLRWYGLNNLVVKKIKRQNAHQIEVTLVDLDSNETYRKNFAVTLTNEPTLVTPRAQIAA